MAKTKFWTFWNDEIDYELIKEYKEDEKWKWHRERVHNYNRDRKLISHLRVTKESLKLKDLILKELGINVFPVPLRVYNRDMSSGAWKWLMFDEDHNDIGSSESVKELVKAKSIDMHVSFGMREISSKN